MKKDGRKIVARSADARHDDRDLGASMSTQSRTNPRRIYLDHNASTRLHDAARDAMSDVAAQLGNPSSIHGEGRAVRHLVESARTKIAAWLGAPREELVFTSGGTEANGLAITGLFRARRNTTARPLVVALATDHPSVIGTLAALREDNIATALAVVDGRGVVDLTALQRQLDGGATVVAMAAVNHELGVINDVGAIAAMARAAGAAVHVDAVQAAGKLELSPYLAVADTVAISAHKLGGPAGVGALWVRAGVALPTPWAGGHQERERRPGTENVVGIVGFGSAIGQLDRSVWAEVTARGDGFERALVRMGARVHGDGAPRVGGTINVGFAGARGDAVVIALDLAGIAAATGAACSSGSVAPSPVLLALGLAPAEAATAVRFSLGRDTSDADIEVAAAAMPAIIERIRTTIRRG